MSDLTPWGLIGYGTIGKEVAAQLSQPAVSERMGLSPLPDFVARTSGIMAPDGRTPLGVDHFEDLGLPPVTFSTLPSGGDGETAMGFYRPILKAGKMVITAEKAGIVHFRTELGELSDDFARFGDDATVGGGAHLKPVAELFCHDPRNVNYIYGSFNGTMDNIFGNIAPVNGGTKKTVDGAVAEAKRKGFAEPEAETTYDVIRGETEGDFPKKIAIMFNGLGLSEKLLDWHELEFALTDEEIGEALKQARQRRFIVSIYPEALAEEHVLQGVDKAMIGGFSVIHDGWQITAGFQYTGSRSPLSRFNDIPSTTGAGNAIMIGLGPQNRDGTYFMAGDGAGPAPTANAMLDNYLRLRGPVNSRDALPSILPKELKDITINTVEGPGSQRLTDEARSAWELHQAGLECQQRKVRVGGPTDVPIVDELRELSVLNHYRREGVPVFFGPAAILERGALSVTSSDKISDAGGLWIPRKDQEVNPDAIKRPRLV